MNIDYKLLQGIIRNMSQKKVAGESSIEIKSNMYPFLKKLFTYIEKLDAYQIAAIILDMGHWEKSRLKSFDKNTKPYKYNLRDIVMVNLGATNYGYEASYKHPCIVLANGFNWILAIPCSTGRYDVKSDYIIKGEICDGFKEKTGIQIDKIRVVDKWRIEENIKGSVSASKFKEINDKIIEKYFEQIQKRLSNLTNENILVLEEKEKLVKENTSLKKEIEDLKKQLHN